MLHVPFISVSKTDFHSTVFSPFTVKFYTSTLVINLVEKSWLFKTSDFSHEQCDHLNFLVFLDFPALSTYPRSCCIILSMLRQTLGKRPPNSREKTHLESRAEQNRDNEHHCATHTHNSSDLWDRRVSNPPTQPQSPRGIDPQGTMTFL